MKVRLFVVAMLMAATCSTAAAAWGAPHEVPGPGDGSFAPARSSEGHHCISPEGVDANQLLGISQPLFVGGACNVFETGESYVPLGLWPGVWYMNTSWQATPADYIPSASTPLEDFTSKVRSVTYVVDPDTKHERSYRFTAKQVMVVRTVHDFFPQTGPDWPDVLFLVRLPPLPPGDHRLETLLEMSARHCDGVGTDPDYNCLSAGITSMALCPFRVVPRGGPAWRS